MHIGAWVATCDETLQSSYRALQDVSFQLANPSRRDSVLFATVERFAYPETRVARLRVAREMNGGLCDKRRKGLLF
jgi:hypothetical protein